MANEQYGLVWIPRASEAMDHGVSWMESGEHRRQKGLPAVAVRLHCAKGERRPCASDGVTLIGLLTWWCTAFAPSLAVYWASGAALLRSGLIFSPVRWVLLNDSCSFLLFYFGGSQSMPLTSDVELPVASVSASGWCDGQDRRSGEQVLRRCVKIM